VRAASLDRFESGRRTAGRMIARTVHLRRGRAIETSLHFAAPARPPDAAAPARAL